MPTTIGKNKGRLGTVIEPKPIARLLNVELSHIGEICPVQGGSLTQAYRVIVDHRPVFVKHHPHPVPNFFETEAAGLRLLAETGTVQIPQVLAVDRHYLVLSWINPDRSRLPQAAESCGRELARLHQLPVSSFGLPVGNVVGIVQPTSPPYTHAASFYREQRLWPLFHALTQSGQLNGTRRNGLEWILDHLSTWIDPVRSRPSLLHGDLWSGNWIPQGTRAYLVDPAVLYGDRESELAFTELFGGFPPPFYAAYQEVWPLEPDYPERRPLYQLYHLLVHLLLFGESYGPAVDRIIRRYAGR